MTPTEKKDAAVRQLLETAFTSMTAADAKAKLAKDKAESVAALERELLAAKAANAKAAAENKKHEDRTPEIQTRRDVAKNDELAAKKAADAAAVAASEAKQALVAALAPTGWTAKNSIAVGFFGVALGVLTSLTTTTGITATVVGLLFTFFGVSLLSWFQRDKVSLDDRAAIAGTTGAVGIGLLIGLFLGFGCRSAEEMWIRPHLIEVAERPAKQARDDIKAKIDSQLKDLKQILSDIQPKEPPPDRWKEVAESLKRLEALSERLTNPATSPTVSSGLTTTPVSTAGVPLQPRYVFITQDNKQPQTQAAAKAAETVLKWDKNPENTSAVKLVPEQQKALEEFKQALVYRRNPSPETVEILGELLYRDGPSPVDDESAKTLKKLVRKN
ncbi:MAG: hypothetical protein KY475_11340 [Planctomycetes bacterium]|nr:hypothetical protein [Planctomycetota bacterium]